MEVILMVLCEKDDIIDQITLKRSVTIALLVRLEISDIPYSVSSSCRNELADYLCNVIMENTIDEKYISQITIDVKDMSMHIKENDDALKILKAYSENI